MKTLIIASEISPFIATGDLAESVYSVAKGLSLNNESVSVMLPFYKAIKQRKENFDFLGNTFVNIGNNTKYVGIYSKKIDAIDYYFIDNEEYFGHDTIYGHHNDGERFTYFSQAALEALHVIKYYPDVINIHDWQSGIIPYLLKSKYKYNQNYRKIKTIFTIHDLKYQGIFPIEMQDIIDANISSVLYVDNKINFTKAAIVEADYITTVSHAYHKETLTEKSTLQQYLIDRKDEYVGILTGFDDTKYNPKSDNIIYLPYDSSNFVVNKEYNKTKFKEEFGFSNTNCMLIGFAAIDIPLNARIILKETLDWFLNTDIQVYFLLQYDHDNFVAELAQKYPDRIKYSIGIKEEIGHKLFSAVDMIIHPHEKIISNTYQLISLFYGDIPLVHETGKMKEFITPYNAYTGEGNGFSFINISPEDFTKVFDLAYGLYRFNRKEWNLLVKRNLEKEFGCAYFAKEYINICKKITNN